MPVRFLTILALCFIPRPLGTTNHVSDRVDLAITHASVLDVRTGRVLGDRTVLIRDGNGTAYLGVVQPTVG